MSILLWGEAQIFPLYSQWWSDGSLQENSSFQVELVHPLLEEDVGQLQRWREFKFPKFIMVTTPTFFFIILPDDPLALGFLLLIN